MSRTLFGGSGEVDGQQRDDLGHQALSARPGQVDPIPQAHLGELAIPGRQVVGVAAAGVGEDLPSIHEGHERRDLRGERQEEPKNGRWMLWSSSRRELRYRRALLWDGNVGVMDSSDWN